MKCCLLAHASILNVCMLSFPPPSSRSHDGPRRQKVDSDGYLFCNMFERDLEVFNDIINMLQTDGDTDHVRGYARLPLFFLPKLLVCG